MPGSAHHKNRIFASNGKFTDSPVNIGRDKHTPGYIYQRIHDLPGQHQPGMITPGYF